MKTSVSEQGKWERQLEVEVPAERIDREMTAAMKRHQKRLEIPGFRKGKVPLKIIQQRYGGSIRHGIIEDLLPTLIHEAAAEHGLTPAGTPRVTALDLVDGGGLTFTASIDLWPEVEVQGDEGLQLERLRHEVTDAEVDEQLQELRGRHASERTVERPLAAGDVLIADLQKLDETGIAVIGERYEERYFQLGADAAPSPEFEAALIGIQAGEERQVRFVYRSDLPNPELAGKQEHFAVSAREVRERVLPELDDEFAKDVNEGFTSLQALRDHIREQLEERWGYVSRQKVRSDAIEGLLAANDVELPASLVTHYIESVRREHEQQQQQRRGQSQKHQHHHDHDHEHDHEHDHDHDHNRDHGVSDEERQAAERRLKTYLVMEGLRKKLDIKVTDEEFDAYLEGRASGLGLKAADLKRSPRVEDLRRDLEEDKVFELLEARATIAEKTV